jgi:hypothetical protein
MSGPEADAHGERGDHLALAGRDVAVKNAGRLISLSTAPPPS